MPMYGLALVPLIDKLKHFCRQLWYADDAASAGKLEPLKQWWTTFTKIGPKYGYFPNARRTKLLVKAEQLERAQKIFQDSGIEVITSGAKYLGYPHGEEDFIATFASSKSEDWIKELDRVSIAAETASCSFFRFDSWA